jgi:hypothetical protein
MHQPWPRRILGAAIALVTLTGAARAAPDEHLPVLSTLDMFDQLSLERLSLQISAAPQVQQQTKLAEEIYRKNALAKTPDGQATLENSALMFNLFASQFAAIDDGARPKILWAEEVPHDWYGVRWPGSKWGIDNPDNMYRYLVVDGSSRYEIHGQRNGTGPQQETFVIYASLPGTGVENGEGARVISTLKDRDIKAEPDGSFTITVGPEASSEANHLQSGPDARMMFIRDTLNDWTTQFPNRLRVQRVAGPDAPKARSAQELADEAAELVKVEVPYWIKFFEDFNYSHPPNTVPRVYARAGGWGFLTTGWFKLKDDEAWVVTLDPISAAYLAFQVADVWGVAAEYIQHTSGLNLAQSRPNADGTYTYVVSARDPGVSNWIDTVGMHVGMFTLRWQQLADPAPATEKTVRMSKVVKLSDLKKILPAETVWVSPEERRKQQQEHANSFALRFAN